MPSYARFTVDAMSLPPRVEYDYIVVGGGTAGCPLAATLSADHRVLLLERGGAPYEFPSIGTVDGFLQTLASAGAGPYSPAESFLSADGVPNARGRVLGGSSAINAGFYTRAHPEFYNESGVDWDLEIVEEAYEWVESAVVFQPELGSWQSAVRDGLIEAHVEPFNGYTVHHVQGTKIGASTFDSSGRRHSAADLLGFANANNLVVATRAMVERILLSSNVRSGSSFLILAFRSDYFCLILDGRWIL